MNIEKKNIFKEIEGIVDAYKPKKLAVLNNKAWVELSLHQGEFPLGMHYHEKDDELFICLKGEVEILLENGSVILKEGDILHIKAGQKHCPTADNPCYLIRIKTGGLMVPVN